MNWFKKQINKLFDNDIVDSQYYEEEYEDETPTPSNKPINGQLDNNIQNKKKDFKFPMIADEENLVTSSQELNIDEQHTVSRIEESRRHMKNFYQPNAISKVYDVEISGIRDLLEKRQRIKGQLNVINRQGSTELRRVEKEKKLDSIKKDYRNTAPKKVSVEKDELLIPKRKFVPTQVPSPVYGFKKPSKIDELLSKKQMRVDSNETENASGNSENQSIQDSSYLQYEKKIDAGHSDNLNLKDDTALSVETKQNYSNLPTKDEAAVPSFIELDDEVEEKPVELKEETIEKVEEFPILIKSVDHDAMKENIALGISETVKASQQSLVYQETAVTLFEAESVESLEARDQDELVQVQSEQSNEIETIEQELDEEIVIVELEEDIEIEELEEASGIEEFKEEIEIENFYEETELDPENSKVQEELSVVEQVDHPSNSNILNEQPSTIYSEIEYSQEHVQHPIQSEQVQRLVSIALSDSDLAEETEQPDELQENPEIENTPSNSGIAEDIHGVTPSNNLEENEIIKNEEMTIEQPKTKGSSLPFNVLMLKSDKEKYAAKLAQKQMLQHNDDNKEMYRQTTKIEESPEKQRLDLDSKYLPHLPANESVEEKKVNQPNDMLDETNEIPVHIQETESIEDRIEETPKESVANNPEVKLPPKVYVKPSLDFLSPPEEKTEDREWLEAQADVLVESLSYFQVTAQVEAITQGPAVTQFEITVGHGTKVSKIRNLSDDLKLALAAKDIRIQAPIPGKSTIGIEIPNRISRAVQLSEVTCSDSFRTSESPLEAALGLDLTGKPVTIDLRKMPHGLIAGATGSGKSVCINSILISLLYKANPNELKLMLIDPKMVELAPFNNIPHLVSPVISDVKAATAALKWAVEEMERRYQLFAHVGVRDLPRYNKLAESKGEHGHKLPYILIVIDELADLMMMSPADVEEAICRIAQKARACGIHLIVATQRPSVDVITGLIKSNIPTRIAFAVSSQIDSRTIIDSQGAERLLGRGDMLYLGNGMSDPIRLQGTFVTDDEIEEIIEHVRGQGEPDYFFKQDELLKKTEMVEEQDELFEEVCRFVHEQGTASTSSIQRKYHIGYNRAARLIDMLESQGFVSEPRGSKPREVYITDSDLTTMFE